MREKTVQATLENLDEVMAFEFEQKVEEWED